jgi:type I restriction enzyme M protein
MTEADLADFLAKQKTREDSEYSWTIDVSELGDDLDLSVKNPHKVEEVDERTPGEIFDHIEELTIEAREIVQDVLAWDLWPCNNDDGLENLFAEPIDYVDEEGGEA